MLLRYGGLDVEYQVPTSSQRDQEFDNLVIDSEADDELEEDEQTMPDDGVNSYFNFKNMQYSNLVHLILLPSLYAHFKFRKIRLVIYWELFILNKKNCRIIDFYDIG